MSLSFVVRQNLVNVPVVRYCLLKLEPKRIILFYKLSVEETAKIKDFTELTKKEDDWKVKKGVEVESVNYDIQSKVLYEGSGNKLVFQKNMFTTLEIETATEEEAVILCKELTSRIDRIGLEPIKYRHRRISVENKRLSVEAARRQNRKSALNSTKIQRQTQNSKVRQTYEVKHPLITGNNEEKDEEDDSIPARFGRVERGNSIRILKDNVRQYLLETDSIADERTALRNSRNGQLKRGPSSTLFQHPLSIGALTSSKKSALHYYSSDSFKTNNEYKTNKTEAQREFLRNCFLDLNTLHGVFVREFDELATNRLIDLMFKVDYKGNQDIVTYGEVWDQFYIVESGTLKLSTRSKSENEEDLGLNIDKKLESSDSFGITCLLNVQSSNIHVKSETAGTLWAIRKKTFENIRNENNTRLEDIKEIFLQKIITQVKLDYDPSEASYLKNYIDSKMLTTKEEFIPPNPDEMIILCYSGKLDILLEEEYSHSLERDQIHGIRFLEPLHFKATIADISFIAERKTLILMVEAKETRTLLDSLRLKQNQYEKQRLDKGLPISFQVGQKTTTQLATIFGGYKFHQSHDPKKDFSKSTFLDNNSGLSMFTRPQCIDLPSKKAKPLIPQMDFDNFEYVASIGQGQFGALYVTVFPYEGVEEVYVMKIVSREGCFDSVEAFKKLDREKQIMSEISRFSNNNFTVKLYHTFADRDNIFYVLEFCVGGDLAELMIGQTSQSFSEETMKFYICCIILGLESIHTHHIIYRDMKPDNLFIDERGYVKIGDFGISKKSERTYTFWGTLEYQAPEMIMFWGYNKSIDIWGLGIVAFELCYGFTPFISRNREKAIILRNTIEHRKDGLTDDTVSELYDEFAPTDEDFTSLSTDALDFINKVLMPKPMRRLGCGMGKDVTELRLHPFFEDVDWEEIAEKAKEAPYIPNVFDYEPRCDSPDISPFVPTERSSRLPDVDTPLFSEA